MKLAVAFKIARKYKLSAPSGFYNLTLDELRRVVNRGG